MALKTLLHDSQLSLTPARTGPCYPFWSAKKGSKTLPISPIGQAQRFGLAVFSRCRLGIANNHHLDWGILDIGVRLGDHKPNDVEG